MKNYLGLSLIFLSACVQYDERIGIVSKDNIFENGYRPKVEKTIKDVHGVDRGHWVTIIPISEPEISTAIDNATLEHNADAIVNARIRRIGWYIPYIYGQNKITVTGDAVIFEKE